VNHGPYRGPQSVLVIYIVHWYSPLSQIAIFLKSLKKKERSRSSFSGHKSMRAGPNSLAAAGASLQSENSTAKTRAHSGCLTSSVW